MNLRLVSKNAVVAALSDASGTRYDRCIERLHEDPRHEFTITEIPAALLRENLEPKHGVARRRGKIVRGGDELLVSLSDLGTERVSGVFLDHEREHIAIYFLARTLEPIGFVTVEEPPSEP